VFNPDPTLNIVTRINPNLVVAFDPVALLAMTGHPDPFPSLRNPLSANLRVARRLVNNRGVMIHVSFVDPMGRDDR